VTTRFIRVCDTDIAVSGRLIRTGRIDGERYKFLDEPEQVVQALRAGRTGLDLFTFLQRLPPTSPRFAYSLEWDGFACLELSTFDHWWTTQIGFKARNKARLAARRGVSLREVPFDDGLVDGVWKIYNECPVRQGKPFRHYGKPLEVVRRELGTFLESSVFIGAFVEQALVGFAKLTVDDSGTQAGLMHIVATIRHRNLAPANALIAEAVRSCTRRAIPYLVYSRFGFHGRGRDTLRDFKTRNGFRRIDLPRYYVPLTRQGALALRFGLHRRAIDSLPASLVEQARRIRRAWYARRRGAAGEW
jgi:hypothetical protein